MKKIFLTTALLIGAILTTQAQNITPAPKQDSVSIKIPVQKLSALTQVLAFSYEWLPKSQAPAQDVSTLLPIIQALYVELQPKVSATAPANKPLPKKKP